MYLTATRLDLMFSVSMLCKFMTFPKKVIGKPVIMLVVLLIMGFITRDNKNQSWSIIMTVIGEKIQKVTKAHLGMFSILVQVQYLGLWRNNLLLPSLQQKQSILLCVQLVVKLFGWGGCWMNWNALKRRRQCCIVIIIQQLHLAKIQFFMEGASI